MGAWVRFAFGTLPQPSPADGRIAGRGGIVNFLVLNFPLI
jgi:hypothetical protein